MCQREDPVPYGKEWRVKIEKGEEEVQKKGKGREEGGGVERRKAVKVNNKF